MAILQAVKWKEDRKRDFAAYITHEISNCIGDRGPLEAKWRDAIVQHRAALPKTEKEFPWPGASNLEFPLTAIHSDPVLADFMQTIHAPAEYWTVTANREDRIEHAQPLTEFMKKAERGFLNMRQVNERALLDMVVLGTAIYKNHWLHERKSVRDYKRNGNNDLEIQKVVRTKSQPLIEHIPLQHFLIPADAWNIDPDAPIGGARWVAQRLEFTPSQLRVRSEGETPLAPSYDRDGVDLVLAFEVSRANSVDDKIRQLEEYTPFDEKRIYLHEVWARFDVDGDGVDEDVVAIVHYESQTILRTLYNPFLHGKRPFHRSRYLPYFGFYGMGMSEQLEWAQLTATKLLNATIDNVMLANTRMFGVPQNYGMQDTPIFPGKQWVLGPNEQIQEVKLGEVYPSIFTIQGQVLQLAELRSGSNELRSGDISSLPSRTPATSLLEVMRQGNKRFDMIHADFRKVHDGMGEELFQNFAQKYLEDPFRWQEYCQKAIGEEDAAKVIEVFAEGVHEFPEYYGVTTTATSAMVNKEAEKQQFLGMLQILSQVYGQLIQTTQLLQQIPPGSPTYETAAAAYNAGVELTARLLEKFDVQNPEKYLGNLQAIAGMLASQGSGQNAALMQSGLQGDPMAAMMGGGGGAIPGVVPPAGLPQDALASIFGL